MKFDMIFDHVKPPAPEPEIVNVGRKVNVIISVNCARDTKPQFTARLWHMGMWTFKHSQEINLGTIDLHLGAHQSSLPASRQAHLDHALKSGYTHAFLCDDDQEFPPDTILRLLAHKKSIVFANICQKTPHKISGVCLDDDGKRIDSSGRTGLEQVSYGTLGCTLIDLAYIRDIPRPHFEVQWIPQANRYIGEDHYFFRKLGLEGVEFWLDHDISQQVYHIGDFPYGFTKQNV